VTGRSPSLGGQIAWALFDGARAPYNVLVNIFVFSAYFTTVVVPDSVHGQVLWSYTSSVGALLVAIGAPILGAIADAGGRRKPWLAASMVVGIPSMCALWYATPGMVQGLGWIVAALVGGMLFFEYSAIFCNAMLPNVAPGKIGYWSGMGYALGNVSGVILFVFFLFAWSWNPHPLFGIDLATHEPERAVGVIAGLWMLVFGMPLFFFTPDSPGTQLGAAQAIRDGMARLAATLRRLENFRSVGFFLLARLTYNEGFVVLMLFSGVYAATVMHWRPETIVVLGLCNSVAAALAGVFCGWLDNRIGSRRTAVFFVTGSLLATIVVCSTTPDSAFFLSLAHPIAVLGGPFPSFPDRVFACGQMAVATFVTGGLASSRSLMAQLTPPAMLNEFFGIYSMSGTATSFVGPLAIGLVTTFSQSQRAGFAGAVIFLAVGLVLLLRVQEPPATPLASRPHE
jgi:MFS transporter, UMF1 family